MLVLLTFRNVQGSELLRASHSEKRENVSVENHSFFPRLSPDFQLNNHVTEIFSLIILKVGGAWGLGQRITRMVRTQGRSREQGPRINGSKKHN